MIKCRIWSVETGIGMIFGGATLVFLKQKKNKSQQTESILDELYVEVY